MVANGRRIADLRFADDITLLGETNEECQNRLDAVNTASRRFGLEISTEKTKCLLVANNYRDLNIELNNQSIAQVAHFKYLGTEVTADNSSALDIKCRTTQATAASTKLNRVWSNPRIRLKTKLRLHNCLIMPVALYGCENWTLNAENTRKLRAFEMQSFRKVLHISWRQHVTNAEVARRAGIIEGNIIDLIRTRQRKWLNNVLQMDNERLPKISLESHHLDRRRRGRPRACWIDGVLPRGTSLSQVARIVNDGARWTA